MQRTPAAILAVFALALAAAIASTSHESRSSREAPPPRGSVQPALVSLRQLEASAFLTRHNLELQMSPDVEHDTVTRVYGLKNRLLHSRLRLILTTVGGDRVIRAELGFAPFLLEGASGTATRALLSDLFGTFVPRTDAPRVADLRAQIEQNSPLPADSTLARSAPGDTHKPLSDQYLALHYRRDSIDTEYAASRVWIDNHYYSWRHFIDTPSVWIDSATIVQIALPRDSLSRVLYDDWDQRPEALGGTLAVLKKCLGREEISDKDAIRTGNTIRYAVWRDERNFVLLAHLDSNELVRELAFQQMNLPQKTDRAPSDMARPFLELARRIVPDVDEFSVFGLQFVRRPGGLERSDTPALRSAADALFGIRGPVVLNFHASSLRFDQLNGMLPRMTLGARGSFGAATDSVPEAGVASGIPRADQPQNRR